MAMGVLGALALPLHAGVLPSGPAELSKFGLFALSELKINDRVHVPPGWIGSNKNVKAMVSSILDANVHARGDVLTYSKSIRGDVNLGGILTITTKTDSILGRLHALGSMGEDTTHSFDLTLDEIPTETGPDISIEPGKTFTIAGDYTENSRTFMPWGVITVKSGATLNLSSSPGAQIAGYDDVTLRGLILEPGANLILKFSQDVLGSSKLAKLKINIIDFVSVNGASVVLANGRPQGLLWNVLSAKPSYPWIYLGPGSTFQGTLYAPKASVNMEASAKLIGSMFANRIEIHQGNTGLRLVPYTANPNTEDADTDGLDDTVEMCIGTDPINPDTDNDGLSDGLEYWGRGTSKDGVALHRFGAVNDLRNGFYVKEEQDELLNPLRPDVLLRLLRYDTTQAQVHTQLLKESNEAAAKNFGISGNYPEIVDSAFAWTSTRRIALHIDAGEGYSVNWPSDSSRWGNASVDHYGGAWIVPQGGVDTGKGPYSWDRHSTADRCNHKPGFVYNYAGCQMDNRLDLIEERITVQKMASEQKIQESFWDLMRFGFMVNDDTYPYGVGGAAYAVGERFFFTNAFSSDASIRQTAKFHELAHTLGLSDISKYAGAASGIVFPFRPSILRYMMGLWGCDTVKWDSSSSGVKGTWHDTRWCGDGGYDGDLVWDTLDQNGVKIPFPLMPRYGISGEMGWDRRVDAGFYPEDVTYSNGLYCPLDLRALNEREGRAICFDRNHRLLPARIPGKPIDWNGNGVLDVGLVNIWTDTQVRRRWFGGNFSGIDKFEDYGPDRDVDDVPNEWSLLHPNISLGLVGVHCNGIYRVASERFVCKE